MGVVLLGLPVVRSFTSSGWSFGPYTWSHKRHDEQNPFLFETLLQIEPYETSARPDLGGY